MKKISLVVPMYNEEKNVSLFLQTAGEVLSSIKNAYCSEIVCINDGSFDGTLSELLKLKPLFPNLKILDLSRNFGKESAITAGLDFATGDLLAHPVRLRHPAVGRNY